MHGATGCLSGFLVTCRSSALRLRRGKAFKTAPMKSLGVLVLDVYGCDLSIYLSTYHEHRHPTLAVISGCLVCFWTKIPSTGIN